MGQPMPLFAPHASDLRYQKLTTIVNERALAWRRATLRYLTSYVSCLRPCSQYIQTWNMMWKCFIQILRFSSSSISYVLVRLGPVVRLLSFVVPIAVLSLQSRATDVHRVLDELSTWNSHIQWQVSVWPVRRYFQCHVHDQLLPFMYFVLQFLPSIHKQADAIESYDGYFKKRLNGG